MILLLCHFHDGAAEAGVAEMNGVRPRAFLGRCRPPPTPSPGSLRMLAMMPVPRTVSVEVAGGLVVTCGSFSVASLPHPRLPLSLAGSSPSVTKRTPEAPLLPTLSRPLSSGAPQAVSGGSMEKQGRGRGEPDNYNLGRFESQAEKQGGSSSCRVWELGLSQKPSPTAQPPREADPSLPFPLRARVGSNPLIYVCMHSFMKR